MSTYLNSYLTLELTELAIQAKIPDVEYLIREELLDELKEDYWKALTDAVAEHYWRTGVDLTDLYFGPEYCPYCDSKSCVGTCPESNQTEMEY